MLCAVIVSSGGVVSSGAELGQHHKPEAALNLKFPGSSDSGYNVLVALIHIWTTGAEHIYHAGQ
jgi:hypothetical protein